MTSFLRSLFKVCFSPVLSNRTLHSLTKFAGARAYLIRQVLHDWPDKVCVVILKHLAAALSRGYSKILISEFVVPATGASGFVSGCDLMMMGLGGGMERTETQWQGLLNSAGLSIERIWSLDELTESLIEAVLL